MFCEKCGQILGEGVSVCTNCGFTQGSSNVAASVSAPTSNYGVNSNSTPKGNPNSMAGETTVLTENMVPAGTGAGMQFGNNVSAQPTISSGNMASAETTVLSENMSSSYSRHEAFAVSGKSEPVMKNTNQNRSAKSSGKSGKSPVLVFVALVLVAILAVGAFNFKVLANTVKKAVLDPVEYYQDVETRGFKKAASVYGKMYDLGYDRYMNMDNTGMTALVKVDIGKSLLDLMTLIPGMEDPAVFSQITVDGEMAVRDEQYGGKISLGLGTNPIISVNGVADIRNLKLMGAIEELSGQYIGIEAPAEEKEVFEKMLAAKKEFEANLPQGEGWEEIIKRYTDCYVNHISHVTMEDVELTIGDVTQKCTQVQTSFTEKELLEIEKDCLLILKEDNELLNLEAELLVMSGEAKDIMKAREMVDESVSESLVQLEDEINNASEDTFLNLTAWVDKKGQIIGREMEDLYNESMVFYQILSKSKQHAMKAAYKDYFDCYELEGKFAGGLKELQGELQVFTQNEEGVMVRLATLAVEHMGMANILKGEYEVVATLIPEKQAYEEMDMGTGSAMMNDLFVKYDLKGNLNQAEAIVKVQNKSEDVFTVTSKVVIGEAKEIPFPAQGIMVAEEEDLNQWLSTVQFDPVLTNMRNAGIPEAWVVMLEDYADQFMVMMQ